MPSTSAWFWLVMLSLGPGFTSHMMMNWALARIPAWFGATLTLAIPVTASIMAWAFLGEELIALQFVGMAVVLVALGPWSSDKRKVATTSSPISPPFPIRQSFFRESLWTFSRVLTPHHCLHCGKLAVKRFSQGQIKSPHSSLLRGLNGQGSS